MSQTTDLIKRLRALNVSQSEISRKTGIPQPRLSRWENGDAPAGADDALKLSALVTVLEAERSLTKSSEPTPATAEQPGA
jgi:transcriptional regulator with XRE-family HTH domain